jgi:flagellar protein FliS
MNGLSVYRENSITTQNKEKIIVLLYEGAMKFLKQSIVAMEANDYLAKGNHIVKAQEIIFELNMCLDMEVGGQISDNLRSLYNFMYKRLGVANRRCDAEIVREVIGLLKHLHAGWSHVAACDS